MRIISEFLKIQYSIILFAHRYKITQNGVILYITADLLSPWAAFATVWGLGATCDYKSRCIFSDWLKKTQKDAQHKIPFPEEGLVYDYRYK